MLLGTPLSAPRLTAVRGTGRPAHARPASRVAPRPVTAFVTSGQQKQPATTVDTVEVRFTLTRKVPFGQELLVCGNEAALGGWELGSALKMSWSEGDVWHARVALPAGAGVEFKFVQQIPNRAPFWETCQNRTLRVDAAAADLACVWSAPLSTAVRPSPSIQQLAELISGAEEDKEGCGGEVTDDDAPARAFKPAASLAQFADAVKQSLSGTNGEVAAPAAQQQQQQAGKAEPAKPAAASSSPAAASSLLSAAAEVLSAEPFDPLALPRLPSNSPTLADAPSAGPSTPLAAGKGAVAPEAVAGKREVKLSPEAEAAVSDIIQAAGPTGVTASSAPTGTLFSTVDSGAEGDDEDEQQAGKAAAVAVAPQTATALKNIGKMAGTVAMGVGAAAMLSAFAVDIADVAMLGAVAAGTAAAMTTPSSSSSKGDASKKQRGTSSSGSSERAASVAAGAAEGEAEAAPEEKGKEVMIAQKASAPGIILAAGVLSAIDAGKKILGDAPASSSSAATASKGSPKQRK